MKTLVFTDRQYHALQEGMSAGRVGLDALVRIERIYVKGSNSDLYSKWAQEIQLASDVLIDAEGENIMTFSNVLTITEREPIIIEGCLVPFEIYDRVKAYAAKTGQWQFIGVRYEAPIGDNPLSPGNAGEPINWEVVGVNLARVRENMRAGRGLIFVLDKGRAELIEDGGMAVILWINPQGD